MYILVPCFARAKWMNLYWWHQPAAIMWVEVVAHAFIKYGATIRLIKIVKYWKILLQAAHCNRFFLENLFIEFEYFLQVKQTLYH